MNLRERNIEQKQTSKGAERYHFRLDTRTHTELNDAVTWFEENGLSYSSSCIVRRAVRMYREHLLTLADGDAKEAERKMIDVARRGE